jgi:hypothetical protein
MTNCARRPRVPVIGVQSGLASAPISPQAVQTMRRFEVEQRSIIGKPIKGELGAVVAPGRDTGDEQIGAAVAAVDQRGLLQYRNQYAA